MIDLFLAPKRCIQNEGAFAESRMRVKVCGRRPMILASDDAIYITGVTLYANGGINMR